MRLDIHAIADIRNARNGRATTRLFGTYRIIVEQQRFLRVCAYAQTRMSIRCSYTQSMGVYEDPGQMQDL